MHLISLDHEEDFDGWRDAARSLALAGIAPEEVIWRVGTGNSDLFAKAERVPRTDPAFSVPRPFIELAQSAVCHSDSERFALLYALLLRARDNPSLLDDEADGLIRRVQALAKEVRRAIHKMHAFVRFREISGSADTGDEARYVAWFEPDHHIVRSAAGFFARRFPNMAWSILTPDVSAHWDRKALWFGPGAVRCELPAGDPLEETWKAYYAATFNPAWVKARAMKKEMPKKYWKNMPETALIGELLAGAQAREAEMVERSNTKEASADIAGVEPAEAAERRLQPGGNALAAWTALLEEARGCTRCHLYKCATQTVFGEGPLDARILFVGEQPGDQEDLAGRPFVGPAGRLFDRALAEAGIDRAGTYVTNAVKHFKFEQRGKRRIHQKPVGGEIAACRWWLEQERALIRPPLTIALGATAARSVFGKAVTIAALRGRPHPIEGGEAWVTVHPSFLLRVRDDKEAEYARFVEDLRRVGERARALA